MSYGSMDQMDLNRYYLVKGKRMIFITFSLSIIIHIGFIAAFHRIFPFSMLNSERRTYKIRLIRPPVNDITESWEKSDPDISKTHSELPVKTEEETISLDTKNPVYHAYTKAIEKKIFDHWTYPLSAKNKLIQGNLLIVFRLDRNGNLMSCSIEQPSGHEILDQYAMKAIKSANPFPGFPENITVQFLNIYASFAYQLTFE
jgi:TonB family protein